MSAPKTYTTGCAGIAWIAFVILLIGVAIGRVTA